MFSKLAIQKQTQQNKRKQRAVLNCNASVLTIGTVSEKRCECFEFVSDVMKLNEIVYSCDFLESSVASV